jgi:hypothetical protein
MKLNICYDDKGHIANYTNINISDDGLNINHVVNNSCEEIIVSDTLDYIPYENINKTLFDIIQKIRLNGKLIIVGTDVRCVCRLTATDAISIEQFCSLIRGFQSMNTEFNIKHLLASAGLKVESSLINHHKYEIIAVRKEA